MYIRTVHVHNFILSNHTNPRILYHLGIMCTLTPLKFEVNTCNSSRDISYKDKLTHATKTKTSTCPKHSWTRCSLYLWDQRPHSRLFCFPRLFLPCKHISVNISPNFSPTDPKFLLYIALHAPVMYVQWHLQVMYMYCSDIHI